MDYPKILGFDRDRLIGLFAGLLVLGFMSAILFTHAQLDEETPENLTEADRAACQLARWETNASYQWNESTQSCEKQVNQSDTVGG